MSEDLMRAYSEFKRLLVDERGRAGAAEALEFAAAVARAEAAVEASQTNVVPFKREDAA